MKKEYDVLDHKNKSPEAAAFEKKLSTRVIGQEDAVQAVADIFQVYLSKLTPKGRPLGTLLFLGPTGTGKTRTVEAAGEVVFGGLAQNGSIIKVDCAEFQHSHEIAKLIGSPPGYLGHRETSPLLTQENIDRLHTEEDKLTFVLFDEIEKASDALWNLLLGILDKATLTLGDNRRVDFSRCVIVMTSNLGAREMQNMVDTKLGFAPSKPQVALTNEKMSKIAVEAARRKFSPEFMNRIDKVVAFQTLEEGSIKKILDLELNAVQDLISMSEGVKFSLAYSARAKHLILSEGIDRRYNARPLKRAIERLVVLALANLRACGQVVGGDEILVDANKGKTELVFKRLRKFSPAAAAASELLERVLDDTQKSHNMSLVKR